MIKKKKKRKEREKMPFSVFGHYEKIVRKIERKILKNFPPHFLQENDRKV